MPHTVPGHGGEEGWPVPDPRSPYLDFAPTPPSFDIVHGLDNEGGVDDAYNDVDVYDDGFPAKYYSPYSN